MSTAAPRPPETPDHRQDGPREHDRQVREEVTDLGNELAGLEAEVEERRREVHHLEARLRAARERSGGREGEPVDAGSVAPSDVPSTAVLDDGTFMVGADAFVRDPTVHRDEIEWFLLGRLAAQRQVSFAGSLPLLLDDALHGLHQEDLELLLDRLSQTADAVQLVYLSDDPTVVEWALRLGPFVGALVEAPSPEL